MFKNMRQNCGQFDVMLETYIHNLLPLEIYNKTRWSQSNFSIIKINRNQSNDQSNQSNMNRKLIENLQVFCTGLIRLNSIGFN